MTEFAKPTKRFTTREPVVRDAVVLINMLHGRFYAGLTRDLDLSDTGNEAITRKELL